MLRDKVHVNKVLPIITKILKEKYILQAKVENNKLVFTEKGNETFKVIIEVGKNGEQQRVLQMHASEARPYWKEMVGRVVDILMKTKCLNSYGITASLRKNLHNTVAKPEAKKEEQKPGDKKEEPKPEEKKEEQKQEQKPEEPKPEEKKEETK